MCLWPWMKNFAVVGFGARAGTLSPWAALTLRCLAEPLFHRGWTESRPYKPAHALSKSTQCDHAPFHQEWTRTRGDLTVPRCDSEGWWATKNIPSSTAASLKIRLHLKCLQVFVQPLLRDCGTRKKNTTYTLTLHVEGKKIRPTKHNSSWEKFCKADVYLPSLAFTCYDKQIFNVTAKWKKKIL